MSAKIMIFDLGKVLFDYDLHKFVSAFSKKTSKKGEDINKLIFEYSDIAASFETGKITSFDFYKQLADSSHYSGSYNEFTVIWNEIFTPIDASIEILAAAARKNKTVLMSNTNELHFEYLKARYPQVFLLFSDMHISYLMRMRKPDDEIYEAVIKYHGVSPEQLFFTDDLQVNVDAAKKNGIKAYRFTSPAELLENMRKENIEI